MNEVKETIIDKLKATYDNATIKDNITFFENEEYEKMLPCLRTIGIAVSYDMGWQKSSTGRVYDSLSGHGYLIGCRTRNVIAMGVLKKKCSTCGVADRRGVEIPSHTCNVNHVDSSGSMEASLALNLTIDMYNKTKQKIYVREIVTDDDSTMRAHIKNK